MSALTKLETDIARDAISNLEHALEKRKRKWWDWHLSNPHVWSLFERYAFEAISSGRKNYSHWAILQRIRWNYEIETRGGEFKISNDYIAWYARMFAAKHPEHRGFFRLKPLKEETALENLKRRHGAKIYYLPNKVEPTKWT
jgi:hypothetical protein